MVSLIFAFAKLDLVVWLEIILAYVLTFLFIYIFSKYYMRVRFKKKEEWFGQWDIYLALTIWALSWFIFYYNIIEFNVVNLIDLLLIYVVLSSSIGLIYALINRFLLNGHKQLIPFLPSMILAFWILLLCGDIFISILQ
jgi:prepilin signal peptidase PulO-like enzyme (type II secretory pathway)